MENVRLSDETMGTRSITIRSSSMELLSRSDLNLKEYLAKKKGENVEYIELTPDYIRNIEVDVKLAPVDITGESDNSEKILFTSILDKAQQYFPDLMDRNAWYRKMLEMNDQDASELTAKQPPMMSLPGAGMTDAVAATASSPGAKGSNGIPMNPSALAGKIGRTAPQPAIAPRFRQMVGV